MSSPSPPFTGLVAAPHTPFVDEGGVGGALDLGRVPDLAGHLASDGVAAVFVAGATGEGGSLSFEEKRDLFEVWAEIGPARGLRVIAQVGGECVRDAVRLAEFCGELGGVEALGVLAPTIYKTGRPDDVARCVGRVVDASPSKPVYYYDIPALTGLGFSARDLARAFDGHAPGLCGIKCSRYEGVHVLSYLEHDAPNDAGRYDVLCGTDEALLSALVLGVRGAVGSMYNFAAPLFLAIMDAHQRSDLEAARRLQARSIELVEAVAATGYMSTARVLMAHLGVDVGPARLPFAPLDASARRALFERLEAIGFERWGRKMEIA